MPVLTFLAAGLVVARGARQNLETECQKFTIDKFVEAEFNKLHKLDLTARLNVMLKAESSGVEITNYAGKTLEPRRVSIGAPFELTDGKVSFGVIL